MRPCSVMLGLVLLPLLALPIPRVQAAVYCDLRVEVEDWEGRPENALVALKGERGNVLAETKASNGVAEFCDVGFQSFDLVVRNFYCGEIVLPRLSAKWPNPRTAKVVLYSCAHDMLPLQGCTFLLRVRGSTGSRLAGAVFEFKGKTWFGKTDALGRLWAGVTDGSKVPGIIRKEGYQPREVELDCTSGVRFAEKELTMQKADLK